MLAYVASGYASVYIYGGAAYAAVLSSPFYFYEYDIARICDHICTAQAVETWPIIARRLCGVRGRDPQL